MMDDAALLRALQHGDSFFPSGAAAFSWGLEALCADGQVAGAADVGRFLEGQLRHRWATCDRPFLTAAHRAGGALDQVASIDRSLAAMTLPRELRDGAARAGGALLNIHERLGTPGAAAYRQIVRDGHAPGHLAVVQGLLWAGVGLDEAAASAVSAHALSVGIVSAALRLSVISHIDAQRILTATRGIIAGLMAEPVLGIDDASVFTPATDIAAMRHETQITRLFAN
ncbi:MAG TPA: urease accessory UreF family protein [Methylomirabilota bacterium]|nr:urease accessory UreF family protein [Methylomirabilota bacterium]